MAPSSQYDQWPPESEPITPAAVICRLDHLGWLASRTRLLDHTSTHAVLVYDDGVSPRMWPVVDLRGRGHTVAVYGTEESALAAFAAIRRGGDPR